MKLGLTSFGGPIAHLGYFQKEFVQRRGWLSDAAYAELVALCQFLPGPASSQVGMALGVLRGGVAGALAAWLGFTLPSAVIMIAFGYGLTLFHVSPNAGWLHGLKIAAVAVVAQAVWTMARRLTPDAPRAAFAGTATLIVLVWPHSLAQIAAIALGAVLGWRLLPARIATETGSITVPLARRVSVVALTAFFVLLVLLPLAARTTDAHVLAVLDTFYRTGALVFGGGHVILPLLRVEVVPNGWISDADFLAGYGLAQALPGPLFTFAGYLGTVMQGEPHGWRGGLLAIGAIFLPSFLLLLGALPHWSAWRARAGVRAALNGVNAAVVGILLAALYDPIFVTTIHSAADLALAVVGFILLWRGLAPLWVVVLCAGGGLWLAA